MSGIVYVDNIKEDKAGSTFDEKAQIEVEQHIKICESWWFKA